MGFTFSYIGHILLFQGTADWGDVEPVSYISPSADGAYIGESFDDVWMFERDWVVSKGASVADKQKGEGS